MLGAGSSPVSLGGEVCAGPAKRSRGRRGAPGTRERGSQRAWGSLAIEQEHEPCVTWSGRDVEKE